MNFQTYETIGHGRYAKLAEAVASILAAAIHLQPALRLQHVQRRAKDSSSLAKKLAKAGALDSADIGAVVKEDKRRGAGFSDKRDLSPKSGGKALSRARCSGQ